MVERNGAGSRMKGQKKTSPTSIFTMSQLRAKMATSSRQEQMGSSSLHQTAATIGGQPKFLAAYLPGLTASRLEREAKACLSAAEALFSSQMTQGRAGEHSRVKKDEWRLLIRV